MTSSPYSPSSNDPRPPIGAGRWSARALTLAALLLVSGCGSPAVDSAGPTPATASPPGTTAGTAIVTAPGTTPGTTEPGTVVPPATEPAPVVILPPVTSAAVPVTVPPGNAIPGGPPRTKALVTSPPTGPCTETAGHVDRLSFQSNVLALDQPQQRYLVYTPRCYRYDTATRYPVLYLFHGAQTDETQWESVGIFTADRTASSVSISRFSISAAVTLSSRGGE